MALTDLHLQRPRPFLLQGVCICTSLHLKCIPQLLCQANSCLFLTQILLPQKASLIDLDTHLSIQIYIHNSFSADTFPLHRHSLFADINMWPNVHCQLINGPHSKARRIEACLGSLLRGLMLLHTLKHKAEQENGNLTL